VGASLPYPTNQAWREEEGGALRTFPREAPSETIVGADDGNLQV